MRTFVNRLVATTLAVALLAASHAAHAQAPPADYLLGRSDVLSIAVYEQAELTGKFTIAADGTITFPLIGRVEAGGKTARAVEVEIRTRLADGYLRSPQVTVEILEFNSQRIFVVGAVSKPGPVAVTGALTLLEALAAAGGPTESAGSDLMLVRARAGAAAPTGPLLPTEGDDVTTTRLSLRDIENGVIRENVALRHGDTLIVPRAEAVFVLGQVNSPGEVPFQRGMTVSRALALAGGLTQLGSEGRVRIVRTVNGEMKELKAKLSDVLEPGDTVKVPTRLF